MYEKEGRKEGRKDMNVGVWVRVGAQYAITYIGGVEGGVACSYVISLEVGGAEATLRDGTSINNVPKRMVYPLLSCRPCISNLGT